MEKLSIKKVVKFSMDTNSPIFRKYCQCPSCYDCNCSQQCLIICINKCPQCKEFRCSKCLKDNLKCNYCLIEDKYK